MTKKFVLYFLIFIQIESKVVLKNSNNSPKVPERKLQIAEVYNEIEDEE